MKRVRLFVTAGWILAWPALAGAQANWLLLIPPVDQDKLSGSARWTEQGLGPPLGAATEALRGSFLNTAGPLGDWMQLGTYDSPAACEGARLRFQQKADTDLKAFQRSLEQQQSKGIVFPEDMVRLVFYSQASESRCVPPPGEAPSGGSPGR
jgi:hypothetical protein